MCFSYGSRQSPYLPTLPVQRKDIRSQIVKCPHQASYQLANTPVALGFKISSNSSSLRPFSSGFILPVILISRMGHEMRRQPPADSTIKYPQKYPNFMLPAHKFRHIVHYQGSNTEMRMKNLKHHFQKFSKAINTLSPSSILQIRGQKLNCEIKTKNREISRSNAPKNSQYFILK